MKVFGKIPSDILEMLTTLRQEATNLLVPRKERARSSDPFPSSTDLELCLKPLLGRHQFEHHVELTHPTEKQTFEYDFFHASLGLAIEIMGYRADDEIYKNLLKFHVHAKTRVGVVWVPKKKWISGKATETNYLATLKALTFADTFMRVEALVAVPYDWETTTQQRVWKLVH